MSDLCATCHAGIGLTPVWWGAYLFCSPACRMRFRLFAVLQECPACEGAGGIPIAEHVVTPDMASDAGEPAMAGQSDIEWGCCPQCEGEGTIMAMPRTSTTPLTSPGVR